MKKLLLFAVFLLCFFSVTSFKAYAAEYDGKTLDYGIYWFGEGNISQKYVEGVDNPYFDPNKPTIIYVHGWQKDSTKKLKRENFNLKQNNSGLNLDVNSCDYWINAGWNIGIFYWNQFADESEVKDAEAKIWTNTAAKKLRWRKVDGSYEDYTGPEKSISEIFKNQYISAMKNFTGSEIRFAGHSLGNQVVTNTSKLINDSILNGEASENIRPDRIALLDPFWSKGKTSYLKKWTGEVCREYVADLKNYDVIFEEYKSSNINDFWIGDSNLEMRQITLFTDFYPDYISFTNQAGKHRSIKDWYFYSFGFDPPKETIDHNPTGNPSITSSTPTSYLRTLVNSGYSWYQDKGKNSVSVTDDTYERINS